MSNFELEVEDGNFYEYVETESRGLSKAESKLLVAIRGGSGGLAGKNQQMRGLSKAEALAINDFKNGKNPNEIIKKSLSKVIDRKPVDSEPVDSELITKKPFDMGTPSIKPVDSEPKNASLLSGKNKKMLIIGGSILAIGIMYFVVKKMKK